MDNNGGLSPYGTRGQNGNIFEWQESAFTAPNDSSSEPRSGRGAAYGLSEFYLRPTSRVPSDPATIFNSDDQFVGFRVASVPEPSSAMVMIGSGLMLLLRRPSRFFPCVYRNNHR